MKPATSLLHEQLDRLGRSLGFDVRREVSNSVLSLRLDRAYTPRVDLLWSLRLSSEQATALGEVTGENPDLLQHLPVVGIEVEGTTPSTKTMAADVANIAALGTKLGILVVSERAEKGIYRRAVRAIRSVRRSFGDLAVVPMDASWLARLCERDWPIEPPPLRPQKSRAPAGGERLEWSASTRKWLRALGERAGFVVAEPYVPGILEAAFEFEMKTRKGPVRHCVDPLDGRIAEMKRPGDFLTECQIDLAWLLPLPVGLRGVTGQRS